MGNCVGQLSPSTRSVPAGHAPLFLPTLRGRSVKEGSWPASGGRSARTSPHEGRAAEREQEQRRGQGRTASAITLSRQ